MNSERWQQLDRIFIDALQLPREARADFVAHACGADDALRTEAASLLASVDTAGDFMANPAFERLAKAVSLEGWSLRPGERVGAYTIVRLLGSGGAGEVWRARDERLGRDVAIKVLLPHYAGDDERVRRFAEEAHAAGALNHTNILTVYDVGEHGGTPFLVSECLEGGSLRQRLDAGALPLREAVTVALGIAHGLTAAHGRGIIHRDLKPENVFLRTDGSVKILDFGLAKLRPPTGFLAGTTGHTATGTIHGTAGYMAPEQVRGEDVDARCDLFALGVMLYEMLGGQRPFQGPSSFDTLHAILTTDPPDLLSVRPHLPPQLTQIVMRLLRKLPDARFQSAADLAWALEQVADRPASLETGSAPRATTDRVRRSRWLPWIAAPALTASLLVAAWWLLPETRRTPGATDLMQFTWTLPAGMALDSAPVVSPDGRHVAFVSRDAAGSRLFVHDLASVDALMIPGTEGAKQPFWSPDSKTVGFFAAGKLMKVALAAGAPVVIADAADGRGAAWSPSGVIVFAPDLMKSSLSKVSDGSGPIEAATLLDPAHGENSHRWPVFLPDAIHFLYFVRGTADERRGTYLGRIDRAAAVSGAPLFQSESDVAYVASSPGSTRGDLLYVNDGRIETRSFDAEHLALMEDARRLDLQAGGQTPYHPSLVSASANVLAFATSPIPFGQRLGSVDRDGGHLQFRESEVQNWVRLSPDGQRLARQRLDGVRGNSDIWVDDLARGNRVRVTTAEDPDIFPVWSPDGKRLAYVNGNNPGRSGDRRLSIASADGTGVLQAFPCPRGQGTYCEPTDWLPDGRLIVNVRDVHGSDIWIVATSGSSAQPLLAEPYNERDARVSPNGRWISYVSDESGRPEVSVRSITGGTRRKMVSGNGGDQPVWRRDGRELFFVDPRGRLISTSVHWTDDGSPTLGVPVPLSVPPIGFGHWGTQYDVSPDGRRVYFMHPTDDQPPREIHVVIGWRSLLKDSRTGE